MLDWPFGSFDVLGLHMLLQAFVKTLVVDHEVMLFAEDPGRVPERGVGAVGKSPAGATAESLA